MNLRPALLLCFRFALLVGLVVGGLIASPVLAQPYTTITIDGVLDDWDLDESIASGDGIGCPGAQLNSLWLTWDDQYLYVALVAGASASWDTAYAISIDVNPGTTQGFGGNSDAWGQKINFSSHLNTSRPDRQAYFLWDQDPSGPDGITRAEWFYWEAGGWSAPLSINLASERAATGSDAAGLSTLEMRIPWGSLDQDPSTPAVENVPENLAVYAWIAGPQPGMSAVETLPENTTSVAPNGCGTDFNAGEWVDLDSLAQAISVPGVDADHDGIPDHPDPLVVELKSLRASASRGSISLLWLVLASAGVVFMMVLAAKRK